MYTHTLLHTLLSILSRPYHTQIYLHTHSQNPLPPTLLPTHINTHTHTHTHTQRHGRSFLCMLVPILGLLPDKNRVTNSVLSECASLSLSFSPSLSLSLPPSLSLSLSLPPS